MIEGYNKRKLRKSFPSSCKQIGVTRGGEGTPELRKFHTHICL